MSQVGYTQRRRLNPAPTASQHDMQQHGAHGEAAGGPDPLENPEDFSVIMTVSCSGPHIGVAVYEHATAALSLFQGYEDGKGPVAHALIQQVKLQTSPAAIYTSSKADADQLAALREPIHGLQHDGHAEPKPVPVHLERAATFQHDKALHRLKDLRVAGQAPGADLRAHLALLNTMVDLSRTHQVCALGAMITILQKARAGQRQFEDSGSEVVVQTLSELNLNSCLIVDPVSLSALAILQEERHASLMGLGKAKEGFSLFSLLNRCVTPMGKRHLRSWFLRPVLDLDTINDRLNTVQVLVAHPDECKELQDPLKKVADIPRLLQRLQQAPRDPSGRTYRSLQDSLLQLLRLREVLVGVAGKEPQQEGRQQATEPVTPTWRSLRVVEQLLDSIGGQLVSAHSLIAKVVNTDQSDDDMVIAQGVCQELDELKEMYEGLPDLLTRVLEAELGRVPAQVARLHLHTRQLWSICYLPQVGYAIQVTSHELPEELLEVLPDYTHEFELDSADGRAVFYSTDSTRELSKRFGDMLYKIQDLEASLCVELVERLQQYAPVMQRACAAAATLDCLIAFAATSSQCGYCRPTVTQDNVLHIKGGRHPLAEMVLAPGGSPRYIPNDTDMEAGTNRVHVITGPNASGKSCYVKQVALITFMAHLGCFVPAERAVVGLTDRILTRLVCSEHVAGHASSFSQDLTQVARMVHQATGRSLLVIDEFGKGTLSADGVGLLSALLTSFCARGNDCPRVVTCTHFTELLDDAVLPRHALLGSYTMEVLIGNPASETAPTEQRPAGGPPPPPTPSATTTPPATNVSDLVFLYRLVPGYSSPSFGIHCARLCSVRPDVVQRAADILALLQAKQRVQPLSVVLESCPAARHRSWLSEVKSMALLGRQHKGDVAEDSDTRAALELLLGVALEGDPEAEEEEAQAV